MNDILLETQGICKYFFQTKRKSMLSLKGEPIVIRAVDQCSLRIKKGSTFCLVGESGSGKTTLARTIARIYNATSGSIRYHGRDVTNLADEELKAYRRQIQMVFQDPSSSLNPRQSIETIISLPMKVHGQGSRVQRKERVAHLLNLVQLPTELMPRYPHAISGGQKQRIGIARALAPDPDVVLLDEPTSALDVSVQAKILDLLTSLQTRLGLTYLLITHNLSIVRNLADHIAVMYSGQIVESGTAEHIFGNPLHPYTRALLSAIPVVTEEERRQIPAEITLEGDVPSPADIRTKCDFYSRCQEKIPACDQGLPPGLREISPGHWADCQLWSEDRQGA